MKIDTTPRCCSALTQTTSAPGCSSAPKLSAGGFRFAAMSAGVDQNLKRDGAVASAEDMKAVREAEAREVTLGWHCPADKRCLVRSRTRYEPPCAARGAQPAF